jgi:hypothetical protein
MLFVKSRFILPVMFAGIAIILLLGCQASSNTVAVSGVSLNKTSANISITGSETLVATITPGNAANQAVTWKSSDSAIASVSSSGLVTGVAAGSAIITVTTADGNKTATCTITVDPNSIVPVVATPTFSPPSGLVSGSSPVVISCATTGAAIQYSTDNINFVTGSTYTVTADCTLYAKASKDGYTDSILASATFVKSGYSLQINFQIGTLSPYNGVYYKNIYVAWIKNSSTSFIQNLGVCTKLRGSTLTGTVLPYWKTNIFPSSDTTELDAVTGATMANQDFSLAAQTLKDGSQRKFTVYFETDRSFEANDWFTDQPALLYSADVDLDSGVTDYTLTPCGWTRNEHNGNVTGDDPATLILGTLQTEIRYITEKKPFGTADSASAANMVKNISLKIN